MKFFLITVIVTLLRDVGAATYYVKTNGNNSADGLSVGNAWLTLQKAADTVTGGDVVRAQHGLYSERVTETTDGTAGSPITYLADGALGSVVLEGGFTFNGSDYCRLVGFEITQTSPTNQTSAVLLSDGPTGCEVLDNYIHHTYGSGSGTACGVRGLGVRWLTLRGNRIEWTGKGSGTGDIAIQISGWTNIIEYNAISHSSDYIVATGTNTLVRNNYLGLQLGTNDFPNFPGSDGFGHHIDGWQIGSPGTVRGWMDSNYMFSNAVHHSHVALFQNPDGNDATQIIARRNLAARLGGGGAAFASVTSGYGYNNTFADFSISPTLGATTGFIADNYQSGVCTNIHLFNNIFHTLGDGSTAYFYAAGNENGRYSDFNVWTNAVDPDPAEGNGIEGNPGLINFAGQNYYITNTGLAYGLSAPHTLANGSGSSSTVLVVDNALRFFDGMGRVDGDWIKVGSGAVQVSSINYATHTITLTTARSWSDNDEVWLADPVMRQADAGAWPFRAGGYGIAATFVEAGGTATVTVDPGLVRMLIAYADGLPGVPVYCSTTTTNVSVSGDYEIRAYPRYASAEPLWVAAAAGFATGNAGRMNVGTINKVQ